MQDGRPVAGSSLGGARFDLSDIPAVSHQPTTSEKTEVIYRVFQLHPRVAISALQ